MVNISFDGLRGGYKSQQTGLAHSLALTYQYLILKRFSMQEENDSSMINFPILKALDGIMQELEGGTGV